MIEAHTLDAWTRVADRSSAYRWAMVLAGYGAPFFLFLAGIGLALGAGSRQRKGLPDHEIASASLRRGAQIFAFAFLFRAQAWLISGGTLRNFLKVDILNIMGLSLMAGAVIWAWGRSRPVRIVALLAAAVVCTMATPLVRSSELLNAWPEAVVSYVRPVPGRTTFTLFPWAGFLLAGAAAGLWLDGVRSSLGERSACLSLGALGLVIGVAGYGASYLPSLCAHSEFWTSSPTYFFVRLGILLLLMPIAYGWSAVWRDRWSPLQEFGRSSLFVYWIHVELVYGGISRGIHKALSFETALAGFVLFTVFMFLLTVAKNRITQWWKGDRDVQPTEFSPAGRGA